MPLEPADQDAIYRFVRDKLQQEPPRPLKAHTIGTLTIGSNLIAPQIEVGGEVQPVVTSSPISVGPPARPNDGDIWIATGAGSGGQVWQFRYNAESTSPYKWEFIGGSPVAVGTTASQTLTASTWTILNTGTLTIPRSGDYMLYASGMGANSTSGAATEELGFSHNGVGSVFQFAGVSVPTASYAWTLAGQVQYLGLVANDVMGLAGWSNSATTTFTYKSFSLLPTRVS